MPTNKPDSLNWVAPGQEAQLPLNLRSLDIYGQPSLTSLRARAMCMPFLFGPFNSQSPTRPVNREEITEILAEAIRIAMEMDFEHKHDGADNNGQ
jgi:hypothetical protein